MARPALLVVLALVAGCARSEDAGVVASSNELNSVEQVRSSADDDQEMALGDWRDTLQDESSALEFGPAGAPPLFSLRCDGRRSVYLQRHGAAPAGDLPVMLVTIGSDTRRLAVTNVGGAVPMLRASLAPSDPLVRSLNDNTTPITIRVGDTPPLVLPPSPNIARFVSGCEASSDAGGRDAAEANAAAATNQAASAPPAPRR